ATQPQQDVGILETLGPGLELHSVFGEMYRQGRLRLEADRIPPEEGYDVFKDPEAQAHPELQEYLLDSRSPRETALRLEAARKVRDRLSYLNSATSGGFASVVGSLVNPSTFLPLAAVPRTAGRLARFGQGA